MIPDEPGAPHRSDAQPSASIPERSAWRPLDAGWAILVGLIAALGARTLVGIDASTTELFGVVLPLQATFTLLAVAALAPRRTDWRTALRVRFEFRDLWGFLIGAAVQFALAAATFVLILVFLDGEAPAQDVVVSAAGAIGTLDRIFVALGLIVLGPIAEEVVFRGVLMRAFEQTGSSRRAVALSSFCFAGLHLIDPNALIAVPMLFALGLVLGNQVLRTGRLGRAVTIHAGFNAVTVVVLFSF